MHFEIRLFSFGHFQRSKNDFWQFSKTVVRKNSIQAKFSLLRTARNASTGWCDSDF